MSKQDIIRAWKDEEYRNTLSDSERARIPENPAGLVELPDEELRAVAGGGTERLYTVGCCNGNYITSSTYCGSCRYTCVDQNCIPISA